MYARSPIAPMLFGDVDARVGVAPGASVDARRLTLGAPLSGCGDSAGAVCDSLIRSPSCARGIGGEVLASHAGTARIDRAKRRRKVGMGKSYPGLRHSAKFLADPFRLVHAGAHDNHVASRLSMNVGAMNGRERMRRSAMVMTLVASFSVTCFVAAEPGASKAAADALFAEGRALMTQGKFAEACDKFAESERFEPAVGTSLNLGECHERLGRTASAYGAFGEAKRLAALRKDTEREAHAAERRAALEKRLSRIALSVPSKAPGVKVLLDGQELGAGAIGAAIPLDPGRHVVNAVAPDKPTFEKELMVGSGPVTVAVEVVFPGEKPVSSFDSSSWSPVRSAGVVIGAAGFVGVLVGGGFGIAAIVKNNASKDECSPTNGTQCSLRGVSLRGQAGTFADVSTGTLLAGGALVGIGVGMFFLGGRVHQEKPRAKEIQIIPVVAPGYGGAVAGVEF